MQHLLHCLTDGLLVNYVCGFGSDCVCGILELNKPYWVVEIDDEQVHV